VNATEQKEKKKSGLLLVIPVKADINAVELIEEGGPELFLKGPSNLSLWLGSALPKAPLQGSLG